MQMKTSLCLAWILSLCVSVSLGDEAAKYRTDANQDTALPWFQPVNGQFPPAEAAHYVSGEFIGGDHLERTIRMRVDRNDSQTRDQFDHRVDATMLPYGCFYVHGQPAALQDMPIGGHVHGWFFERPEGEEKHWVIERGKLKNVLGVRESPEVDFTRCLRIEDDFSYYTRRNQLWKVESVDLAEKKLVAILEEDGKPIGKPKEFDLKASTVVYQGDGFGTHKDIKPGQRVLMSLTWATMYSPGRIAEIWLDEQCRKLASERQLERHRDYVRERGVAGWVDAVNDEEQIVTITFFEGVDPKLFEEFKIIVPESLGWPTSGGAKDDLAPKGTIAVATETLITYDPVNDRKGGNILSTKQVALVPGSSGVQIQVQCGMLLEGYRPTKIVRFYPAAWKVVALPREETFFGKE